MPNGREEVRALFEEARKGVREEIGELGVEARGRAARRAALTGRRFQPVQEWTFSDIERGMQKALAGEMGRLGTEEAQLYSRIAEAEKERVSRESYAKQMRGAMNLASILGLVGQTLPWALPGIGKLGKGALSLATGLGGRLFGGRPISPTAPYGSRVSLPTPTTLTPGVGYEGMKNIYWPGPDVPVGETFAPTTRAPYRPERAWEYYGGR